jgi:2-keto-4-pentenoate hydratase/2-oxohepta-3-ene-1,7-dioic acid hydratase in catechol pathway
MRFIRFAVDDLSVRVGMLEGQRVTSVLDADGDPISCLTHVSAAMTAADIESLQLGPTWPVDDVLVQRPIEPRTVIGAGTNYLDHLVEMAATAPPAPTANFLKLPASWAGPDDDITIPDGAFVDYEGEIAVVISRPTHSVAVDDVDRHVLGICLSNDVSARDIPTTQLTLGKSMPGFCPLGPVLVTPDELDLDNISYTVRVNGEIRQSANTSAMVHSIREVVASYSKSLPLQAGDVLLTGSPSGVGVARQPPLALRHGDVVEVDSPQLGLLRNRFLQGSATTA